MKRTPRLVADALLAAVLTCARAPDRMRDDPPRRADGRAGRVETRSLPSATARILPAELGPPWPMRANATWVLPSVVSLLIPWRRIW